MMNKFKRIVKQVVNGGLDSLDDPIKALDLEISEIQEKILKLREQSAPIIGRKDSLITDIEKYNSKVEGYEKKIKELLKEGEDDIAKQLLIKRNTAEEQSKILQQNLENITKSSEDIINAIRVAEQKLSKLKSERDVNITRLSCANTLIDVDKISFTDFESSNTSSRRVEELVKQKEATVKGNNILHEKLGDNLDQVDNYDLEEQLNTFR